MTRSDAELYAPAACCCGCISKTREDFIKFRTERDDTGCYFVSAFEAASTALT